MCSPSQALGTAINSTKVMTAQQVVRTDDGGEVSSTPEMYRNLGFHVCLFGIGHVTCRFTGRQSVKTPLCFFSHIVGGWSELKYKSGACPQH